MDQSQVLVIEDDEDIVEVLMHTLGSNNFKVAAKGNGEDGLKAAQELKPDLILLDVMLPGKNGLAVCRDLKADPATHDIPVVMLTAKGAEDDIVKGLEAGADDYVVKPFRQKELIARMQTILRRNVRANRPQEDAILRHEGLVLDGQKRVVSLDGKKVDLTYSEFGILQCLMANPGWVYTRSQIVNSIRGDGYFVTDRTVDVQVVGLRRKLGAYERKIETVRGVGYRFAET